MVVGKYDANGFGLKDMHGNLWEWVQDCYVDSYKNSPEDGSAVKDFAKCKQCHPGRWLGRLPKVPPLSEPSMGYPGTSWFSVVGFRLARTL